MTERERQRRGGRREKKQQPHIHQYSQSGYHRMEGVWGSHFIVFFVFQDFTSCLRWAYTLYSSFPGKQSLWQSLHAKALLEVPSQRSKNEDNRARQGKGKTFTRCWNFKLSQLHNKTQLTAQSLRSSSERPHGAASQYSQPRGRKAPHYLPNFSASTG